MSDAPALAGRSCPSCGLVCPEDALFCPRDGSPLDDRRRAGDADPYVGREIAGHIEIRHVAGTGAMGRVYRAFQSGIERDVAVKILHRELSSNQQLVQRFTREAKVASRLQHPNVVQVLLSGQLPDGALYIVMEYLDGLSLGSMLAAEGGAVDVERALHIVLQLCDAVGEAHVQGIVHRDIKPENVMLVRRGEDPDTVKVLDFGIARIDWGQQSMATAAGLIFGTARYISPEGAQGQVVGPASDVYSIATLFYQLVAGRTPFDGDQAVGLLVQQIHDQPPPLRGQPRASTTPAGVADVIMKNLAKSPDDRARDARAFARELREAALAAGLEVTAGTSPALRRRSSGSSPLLGAPSNETVKWSSPVALPGPAPTAARAVDATLDDEPAPPPAARAERRPTGTEYGEPAFPAVTATPAPVVPAAAREPRVPEAVRTDPVLAGPPPAARVTPLDAAPVWPTRHASTPERPLRDGSDPQLELPTRRTSPWVVALVCFLVGAVGATVAAYKTGRLGPDRALESAVVRSTDALYKNRFDAPAGDNVRDLTDDALRRWPNEPRILDVRMRASTELIARAVSARQTGDVAEALRVAKLSLELDPHDDAAQRLVAQYGAELAASNAPLPAPLGSAPTGAPTGGKPLAATSGAGSGGGTSSGGGRPPATPRLVFETAPGARVGQTVELSVRASGTKPAAAQHASFLLTGPGLGGGVTLPARVAGTAFKATYAFLEAGSYDVAFSCLANGDQLRAGHVLVVTKPQDTPTPLPNPTATPAPSGTMRWL